MHTPTLYQLWQGTGISPRRTFQVWERTKLDSTPSPGSQGLMFIYFQILAQ